MNTLQQQLTNQGLPTRSLGGGKILLSQFGGRMLALCPDGESQSPVITCQTYAWIGNASSIDTLENLLDLNF